MTGIPGSPVSRPIGEPPGSSRENATLAMPRKQTRTEAQREAAERAEAGQRQEASRWVARRTVYRAHGCSGTRRRLSPEGVAMDELLCELGLADDPLSYERTHWGKAAKGEAG